MKTNLSSTTPSQLETDCLVVVTLDRSEKDRTDKDKDRDKDGEKGAPSVESADAAVAGAAKEVLASGEVTGKTFETTLLHNPTGLKAKRLLLLGGGKAKSFTASELRKLAGAAVRTLKSKSLRSFAFVLPESGIAAPDAVRAIVEGAIIGSFDPGYYKSKDKKKKKKKKQKKKKRPTTRPTSDK